MQDDFHEPATLDDIVNELGRLRDDLVGILGDVKTDLEQSLHQITHAINEFSLGLSNKLDRMQLEIELTFVAAIIGIIGIFGILGTLRHWF